MRVRPQTILLKDVGPTHHVRTPMSAALESRKCWFQDPTQSQRKWQGVGYMSPFIKKKGDNNAGQSHGILVLSMGTSSDPFFADAEAYRFPLFKVGKCCGVVQCF
ncbi:hypothetical protein BDA96_10G264000 [Sorghum bicolor]|uniref:Uncharacterized protein n=2 Tax=Sorghum bicolor TaxID=4558 RepID=A0A921Q462_SORBI|nr:hypothetical protein BDA96_10G264000 [Sorghum bicolor]KXG20454.1 hypothetical protein SORBI_3010G202800 [Sorghum bicolor]